MIGPGAEIDGFVIEAVAGRGGMGVVYRARQKRPDRIVALKVIAPDLADDPAFRTRFQLESSIAAQIEHPNVIPVYAVGEADGTLFIAMRFVDGTDLRASARAAGPPRAGAGGGDHRPVAQALDAAHAQRARAPRRQARQHHARDRGRPRPRLPDGLRALAPHAGQPGPDAARARSSARSTTSRPSRRAASASTPAPTSTRSAACSSTRSPGRVPFQLDNDLAKLYAHDASPRRRFSSEHPTCRPRSRPCSPAPWPSAPTIATCPPATSAARRWRPVRGRCFHALSGAWPRGRLRPWRLDQ